MISITLPLRLPSMANTRMHWAAKAKCVKRQRAATTLALKSCDFRTGGPFDTAEIAAMHGKRIAVTLTRLGPKALDGDNLQNALKGCRDSIAAYFGMDDADPRLSWHYQQQRGPYAVRIELDTELVVNPTESATFARLVSKPPKPNPKLTAAMKRFKARPAVTSFRKGAAP